MEDVLDIVHKISFETESEQIDKMTNKLRESAKTIATLTQKNAEYAKLLKKMTLDETEGRGRILAQMSKHQDTINENKKALENYILTDKTFHQHLVKEQGLIGALTTKLKILEEQRKSATSEEEVKRYSNAIAEQKEKIQAISTADKKGTASLGMNSLSGVMGVASRALPAIGAALGIANIGSQILDVTKKFEGYIQVLNNAYGSSTKAQIAFNKIQQFAAKTPYSVDELTSSFIKLKNRGFDPTTEEMTKMGDLASSQGKSFDQYVEALLDAQTGEYERLKEFGIKAKTVGDQVTFSFKGVEKQVKKTDQEAIRNAIISFGELQGVAGGMAGQAQTLEGKMSNLGDTWDMMLNNIGSRFKGVFGDMIDMANNLLEIFNDLVEKSPADKLREEQAEVNGLFSAIASLNKESEVRNVLITELNAKYPQLLSHLDIENMKSGEVLGVLNGINQAYERRIQLAQQTALKEKSAKTIKSATNSVADFIGDKNFIAGLKYSGLYNDFIKANGDYKKIAEISEKASKKIKGKQSFWSRTTGIGSVKVDGSEYNLASMEKALMDAQHMLPMLSNTLKENGKIDRLAAEMEAQYKAKTKKDFDALLDKVKSKGGIDEKTGKIIDKFDLSKALNLDEMGEFISLFDEFGEVKEITSKPSTEEKKKKKEKKGETAEQKALKKIDEADKEAKEKEIKRHNDYITEQNKLREENAISIEQYHRRLEREEQTHKKNMANINKNTAEKKKSVGKQSKADYAGYDATISQSNRELSDIAREIREKAEQLIKEAISDFAKLNEELLNVSDKTFENEMALLEIQHQKRLKTIEEQRKKEEEAKKIALEEGNTALSEQIQANLDKLNSIEKAVVDKYNNDSAKLELKYKTAAIKKQTELQIQAINSFSKLEKERFEKQYGDKKESIEKELELQKDNAITDEQIQKETGRKKEKLVKEQAKQENIIAQNRELVNLYIRREGINAEIDILRQEGRKLIGEAKKQNEEEIENKKSILVQIEQNIISTSRSKQKQIEQNQKDRQEDKAAQAKEYIQLAQSAVEASQIIVSALEAKAEKEIEIQENRVERAKEIADRGNAEALEEEEKKLDKAQKTKEKYARQQIALNLIMQASQIALAIASAAGQTGVGAIAAIPAVLGALAAGFAAISSFSNSPAFKDGVVDFQGKGTATSDSNLVRISRGESVITAKGTAQNMEILKEINAGKSFEILKFNPKDVHFHQANNNIDISELKKELQEVKEAIKERTPNSIIFDRRGVFIASEEVRISDRKRRNL